MPPINLTHATDLLRQVISEFTPIQKVTLCENIYDGKILLCGESAYKFCDENAGCLLTLATTKDLPTSKYDFERNVEVLCLVRPFYNSLIKTYTLAYYHATQVIDCTTLKNIIKETLGL